MRTYFNLKETSMVLVIMLLSLCSAKAENGAKIVEKNGAFELYVDGVKTYIKGVGGTNRIDLAAQNGANAFRTWGGNYGNFLHQKMQMRQ